MTVISSEALWATVMTFLFLSIPPFFFCAGQLLVHLNRAHPEVRKSMGLSWSLFLGWGDWALVELVWIGRIHPARDERWVQLRGRVRLFGVIGVTAALGAFLLEWFDV